MTQRITLLTYLYRDASNYKFRGEISLLGELRIRSIKRYLFDDEFFIPEKIGMTSLRPKTLNEDDHLLHSIEDCIEVESNEFQMTATEFQSRVRRASRQGWFS